MTGQVRKLCAPPSETPVLTPPELRPKMTVRGLCGDDPAEVVAVDASPSGTVTVTYKADGRFDQRVFYPDAEIRLEVVEAGDGWTFGADPAAFLLAAEAERIGLAWLFDPYLAVHCSLIQALPHQITAVYQEMLPRQPLRFVLADDPGAGKTIMTGLLIRELIARGDLRRCLVISPGSLTEQWRDELDEKFSLKFALHPGSADDELDWFDRNPLAIARLDRLARNEDLQARLERIDWDLVVFDEAHKLSATYFGQEAKYTKRYNFAQRIGPFTRHLLLLTATPHNGKEDDFRLFLRLVDPDRFEGKSRGGDEVDSGRAAAKDLMRRLLKEDLRKFDGSPLFPPRKCYSVAYELSPAEAELYDRVTDYVRDQFNRAERALPDGKARAAVGFALTILQRRLASSPAAIAKSLTRRRERLEATLADVEDAERTGMLAASALSRDAAAGRLFGIDLDHPDLPEDYDEQPDDLPGDELEALEGHLIDRASAARSAAELRTEIAALRELEASADKVRVRGTDTKWEELRGLLTEDEHMRTPSGRRRKLVIFTEHRDTLDYLVAQLTTLLGRAEAVVTIHGGMDRKARLVSQDRFNNDPTAEILVATDAAGEGINLQRASHLMVNYDLPWNPNRLEQRFGRIHRIGQAETCHLWNLVAEGTREGDVYQRLLEKLVIAGNDLDGKIFNVLDRLRYDGRSLRQLMIEAVVKADDPATAEEVRRAIKKPFDSSEYSNLIREHALGDDRLDMAQVRAVRAEMERADAPAPTALRRRLLRRRIQTARRASPPAGDESVRGPAGAPSGSGGGRRPHRVASAAGLRAGHVPQGSRVAQGPGDRGPAHPRAPVAGGGSRPHRGRKSGRPHRRGGAGRRPPAGRRTPRAGPAGPRRPRRAGGLARRTAGDLPPGAVRGTAAGRVRPGRRVRPLPRLPRRHPRRTRAGI